MTDQKQELIGLVGQAQSLDTLNDAMRILRELLQPGITHSADRNLRKQVTLLRARLRDALEADRLGLRPQTEVREEELKLGNIARNLASEVVLAADNQHVPNAVQALTLALKTREPISAGQKKKNQIFLSYRRKDAADATSRIRERLVAQFGRDAVFFDVDSIPLGVNFRAHIVSTLAQCRACLAIVGPGWVNAVDDKGNRRLADFDDPIRIEIETAMRIDRPVIPILVGKAQMPQREELPESLRTFCSQNGFPVRPDPDFGPDMDRLVDLLEKQIF